MLFSSGSSIYGRESAEVPENKANIPNTCRECKFLLHGLGISTLITWYVYRATQRWSIRVNVLIRPSENGESTLLKMILTVLYISPLLL